MNQILCSVGLCVITLCVTEVSRAQPVLSPPQTVEFFSFVDGWNPTNGSPRPLRFGRAEFSLSNNVFRYEITMPTQYAPYTGVIRYFGFGTGHDVVFSDLGMLTCIPVSGTPPDATELELLPRCVIQGSVTLTPQQTGFILSGASVVDIGRADVTRAAWAGILPIDSDHDGIPDFLDFCPDTAAGSVVNSHGCGIEQLAPCAGPWRNHGDYVNRVKAVSADFVKAGLITETQRRLLANQATQSRCGQR